MFIAFKGKVEKQKRVGGFALLNSIAMPCVWGNTSEKTTVLDDKNISDYLKILMYCLYIYRCIYLYIINMHIFICILIYGLFISIGYRIQSSL